MESFQINIAQEILDDLKKRLQNTRWPDEIQDSGWSYGTNRESLKEFCRYWEQEYNWREQEAFLNSFHHYRARIDNFELHYIHEHGKGSRRVPLLLTHGYPDSFARFLKIIPMLAEADSEGLSFDVIIPSIPGFGFSERPVNKGMNAEKIAGLFAGLMKDELGYKQFAAQGGDWGCAITEQLAIHYPELVFGIHVTDVSYTHILKVRPDEWSEAEKKYVEAGKKWQMAEGAYAMIQSTKPQTLAYALNDSPAGLASWILEKFYQWSDCQGNLENCFTREELITNIMLYWVTQTANSACRLYYESAHTKPSSDKKSAAPAAVAIFAKDLIPAPRDYAERVFNLKQFTEMPAGGHFGAWEKPKELAADIRRFFGPLWREING